LTDDSSEEDVKPSARTSSKRPRQAASSDEDSKPAKKRASIGTPNGSSKRKPAAKVKDDEDFEASMLSSRRISNGQAV
jgi:hypothetical protein